MRRIHLFEFEDLEWFPRSIRDAGTDFLRFLWERGRLYRPVVPRLRQLLVATGSKEVVDMGSGGGGPVLAIQRELAQSGNGVHITLTDKFPNISAFQLIKERSGGAIDFVAQPVDATAVPPHLTGLRTMSFFLHHLRPALVRRILEDAQRQRRPIAVFDLSARVPPPPPMLLLGNPIGVLLSTPFIRPFRWSRLLWTYLIPIVPLFVFWDALASGLRLCSVQELREIVGSLPKDGYAWEIGRDGPLGAITYILGYPQVGRG